MLGDQELALPAGRQAAGLARRFLRQVLIDLQDHTTDLILLLATELVANAVLHGAPPISLHVTIDVTAGTLRISVNDTSDTAVVLPAHGWSDQAEGGRGLLLIDALATAWGSEPQGNGLGKSTWFEVLAA